MFIQCPRCKQRPPAELKYASRKWRWLTVHMAVHAKEARGAKD